MSLSKTFNKLIKLGDEGSINKALKLLKEEVLIKNEEDEADKWLKEHESQIKTKKATMKDWQAPKVAEDHAAKISDLMDKGFSEREAHRLVGTHKEHGDAISALKSSIRPSKPSQTFLDHIRDHAMERLGELSQLNRRSASAEKNPQLYAEGRMGEAHADYEKALESALDEFKQSDEFKNAHPMKKPLMISKFRANWANSDEGKSHLKGLEQGYDAHKQAGESRKEYLANVGAHMVTGGYDPDAAADYSRKQYAIYDPDYDYSSHEEEDEDNDLSDVYNEQVTGKDLGGVSVSEAMQHAGGLSGDSKEGGTDSGQVTMGHDTLSSFIAKNPHLEQHLRARPDISERLNRLSSAKKFAESKPEKPEKPKMVIRRRGE